MVPGKVVKDAINYRDSDQKRDGKRQKLAATGDGLADRGGAQLFPGFADASRALSILAGLVVTSNAEELLVLHTVRYVPTPGSTKK